MDKSFYVCKGYQVKFFEKKKLIFFHTPKCAGTTLANILSYLIDKSYRIKGPLTPFSGFKNPKPQITSEQSFNLEKNKIKLYDPNFIFGHFSIDLKSIFNNSLSIAMLRNPISRSISHYNFQIQRKAFNSGMDINECYNKGFILDNIITRQFSGQLNKKKLEEGDLNKAVNNLIKIDLIFNTESVNQSINHLISIYNLPNIIYQNQQVTSKNYFKKNNKNLGVIYNKNIYDLKLYEYFINNNLFFSDPEVKEERIMKQTFFWGQDDKNFKNRKEIIDINETKLIYKKLNL